MKLIFRQQDGGTSWRAQGEVVTYRIRWMGNSVYNALAITHQVDLGDWPSLDEAKQACVAYEGTLSP